jgi:hypothetical protein
MSALKQLLKQNSIAQSSLCKPLGVSTATVNLFVNHGQRPKKNPEQFQSLFTEILEAKGIAADQIQQALKTASNTENDQASAVRCSHPT